MILEQIAIDFRCRKCQMIRRTDADLHTRVADQLPGGWVVENLGVSCARCAEVPAEPAPRESTPKERADERRENIRKLQTASVNTLESPVTAAASPLMSDECTRCNLEIGEMESWRPDPLATGFAKAHRKCLDSALMGGAS